MILDEDSEDPLGLKPFQQSLETAFDDVDTLTRLIIYKKYTERKLRLLATLTDDPAASLSNLASAEEKCWRQKAAGQQDELNQVDDD